MQNPGPSQKGGRTLGERPARILGLRPDPIRSAEHLGRGWRRRHPALEKDAGCKISQSAMSTSCSDEIVDRGAGIMANRTLAAIRKLFNWCVSRDIIAASPCTLI